MKLLRDDNNQIYVWVTDDEKTVLSPHFDYEDDADAWFFLTRDNFKNKIHSIGDICYEQRGTKNKTQQKTSEHPESN